MTSTAPTTNESAPVGTTLHLPLPAQRAVLAERGWPHLLTVAADTKGDYFAHVKELGIVPFTSASDAGKGWAKLTPADGFVTEEGYAFPTGVVVRLDAMLWLGEGLPEDRQFEQG